jgi:SAM-dependent methyltransferase
VPDTTDDAQKEYARRVSSEIDVFARQGPLHRLTAIAGWRDEVFLSPALDAAFGQTTAAGIYATTIAAAIQRSGSEQVFSLGCGDGEQEIATLHAADALGLPRFRIHGLELSPISLARARAAATAAEMTDRFIPMEHDLNRGLPTGEPPAAVMAHHVLHHIVALEPLFDAIAERLHPDGVLVSCDMIGRDGHMLWPEVRPLIRALWGMLPAARRHDHVFARAMPWYQDWDCAIEGFEGVRAQDISRLLAERFEPETLVMWGGISQVFLTDRAGPNFDPASEADRRFITAVQALEAELLRQRHTTPTEMCGTFRSRRGGFRALAEVSARITGAVRRPNERFPVIHDPGFRSPFPSASPEDPPLLRHDGVNPIEPDSPAAAALRDGWEVPEPGGVWAILDEQSIVFRCATPAAFVDLHIWNPCPTAHRQTLSASIGGGDVTTLGPLAHGESAIMRIEAPRPRKDWDIRIECSNYVRPEQEGLVDKRPLAWRLSGITLGGQKTGGLLRRFLGRRRIDTPDA